MRIRGRDAVWHPPVMQSTAPRTRSHLSRWLGSLTQAFLFADPKFSVKMRKSFTLRKTNLALDLLSFSRY